MRLGFGTGCLSGGKTPSLARLASQPRQSSRMAFFFFLFFFVFFFFRAMLPAKRQAARRAIYRSLVY
jgi:hypothetical protein